MKKVFFFFLKYLPEISSFLFFIFLFIFYFKLGFILWLLTLLFETIFRFIFIRLRNWVYGSDVLVPYFFGKHIFIFPIEKIELIFQHAYFNGIITRLQYNALLYELHNINKKERIMLKYKKKIEKYYTIKKFQTTRIQMNQILSILHGAYNENLLSKRQQKEFQRILLRIKVCPNCTTESQRGIDFCPVCGSELVEKIQYNLDKVF